jgi:CheY-like chemotaxis protein
MDKTILDFNCQRRVKANIVRLTTACDLCNFDESENAHHAKGKSMTVLIVDDEEDYKLVLRNILMTEGWDVVMARHGEEALGKLKSFKVDLVISDIYMPVMDGLKFHRAVRSTPELEKMPFLFISGYDDSYTAGATKDPRRDAFYRKGAPIDQLLKWVDWLSTPENKRGKLRPDGVTVSPAGDGGT